MKLYLICNPESKWIKIKDNTKIKWDRQKKIDKFFVFVLNSSKNKINTTKIANTGEQITSQSCFWYPNLSGVNYNQLDLA